MTAVPRIIAGNTASDYPEEGISKKKDTKKFHILRRPENSI